MNRSWSWMAALGLGLIGAWMQVAEAGELVHMSPSVTSEKATARLTAVTGLSVHTFTATERMGAVTLHAHGTASDGRWTERRLTLPKSYRIEKEPYAELFLDPGTGFHDHYHRILYRYRGRDLIAGVASYFGIPGTPAETWDFELAKLTNVGWGYDVKKSQFWIQPDPSDMPWSPTVLREVDWKGRLVALPVDLERYDRMKARGIIESRGGYLARPGEQPDIVLLPDDVDFAWTRNRDAEAWVRRGAKVLWEKNFPDAGDQESRRANRRPDANGVSRCGARSARTVKSGNGGWTLQ